MKRPENGHLDHTSGKCFIFPKIHQPDLPAIFRDEAILPFTENFGYYLAYAFLPSQTRTSWLLGKGLAGFIHSWYLAYTSGRCPPESVMNVVFVGKGCWFTNSWYFDKISRFVNSLFVFKKMHSKQQTMKKNTRTLIGVHAIIFKSEQKQQHICWKHQL